MGSQRFGHRIINNLQEPPTKLSKYRPKLSGTIHKLVRNSPHRLWHPYFAAKVCRKVPKLNSIGQKVILYTVTGNG